MKLVNELAQAVTQEGWMNEITGQGEVGRLLTFLSGSFSHKKAAAPTASHHRLYLLLLQNRLGSSQCY